MALAVQYFGQLEDVAVTVARKVALDMDKFSPQDRMKALVDISVSQQVLDVAQSRSQAKLVKVDLGDCKSVLADRKTILAGPKVSPARAALVGRTQILVAPKVFPERVVLVGHKHTLSEPKFVPEMVFLVG